MKYLSAAINDGCRQIILLSAAMIDGSGQNDAQEEEKYQNNQLFTKNGNGK